MRTLLLALLLASRWAMPTDAVAGRWTREARSPHPRVARSSAPPRIDVRPADRRARRALRSAGRLARRVVVGGVAVAGLYVGSIPAVAVANSLVEPTASTVVFSHGGGYGMSDKDATTVTDLLMYTPVVLRQTLEGHRVEWRTSPTALELMRDMQDPRFDNVVLVGHGAQGIYAAADGLVETRDGQLSFFDPRINTRYVASPPRRNGTLTQLTCGAPWNTPFADVLLRDGSRAFSFDRVVAAEHVWTEAWSQAFGVGGAR